MPLTAATSSTLPGNSRVASWVRPHRVILAAIVVVSILLPGSQLLGEWESLSVFTIYGSQTYDLVFGITRDANIGGQGYPLLEIGRPLIEYLHLPFTLDFIRLPVQIGFLLGRIRAHISMYESSEDATLTLGAYVLRPGLRQLILPDGSAVRLTEKEINILRFLHRANGQPVSREVLLAEIWGYNSQISTHTKE